MMRMTDMVAAALVALLIAGCKTDNSVEPAKTLTPTPEPTPTPTPTPEPLVAEGDYHVVSMTVATSKSQAIDIDGDGKADYGLESALNETVRFMVGRIDSILDELVDAGLLPPELAIALKTAAQATFKSALSVDTVNEGLATMLSEEQWIQVLSSTGDTSVTLEFYTSTPVGQDTFYLANSLGDTFEGTFDEETGGIDASGGTVTLSIPLVSTGTQPIMMDLPLKSCRDIQEFQPREGLEDAKLGGAVSIAAVVDVVEKIMSVAGVLGVMPEDMVTDLQDDVETFLADLSDVTIDGEEAISVSLVYNADPAEAE